MHTVGHATVILVSSRKGGVGKSTVAVNLACALANLGARTLLIDCNFDLRCLDLMLPLCEQPLFDFGDVLLGRAAPNEAVVAVENQKNLFFCASPYGTVNGSQSDIVAVRDAIEGCASTCNAQFVLLDTASSMAQADSALCACADRAILVSTLSAASVRATEQTNLALRDAGVPMRHLLLNGIPLYGRCEALSVELLRAIDDCGAPLLGVVPYDAFLAKAQEQESIGLCSCQKDTERCFSNIAKRLYGTEVALFCGCKSFSRKQILKWL